MSVLEVLALGRRFGGRQVLSAVDFRVERGQVFGLLGPNGSGKTTTLACALGLLSPSEGECRVLGQPARRIHATQGRVGVVFDGANLLNALTVEQNLAYAAHFLAGREGRSSAEALAAVGMADFSRRRVARLSLGERKRIAVARALMGAPELIVLDEPLSALDPEGVESMLGLIRDLANGGTTLVVSSHRLHEMERVITHAGILSRGRLVASGALAELIGGEDERYRLRVSPMQRALEVCAELTGVRCLDAPGAADSELRVALEGLTVGQLNRALVSADCEVSAIVPERRDLASSFAALVSQAAQEVPA